MKIMFALPHTPTCKVLYHRDGVLYQAIMETPKDNEELQSQMFTRHLGMSSIQSVEPIQPPKPLHRQHPAQHQMSQYASLSEH